MCRDGFAILVCITSPNRFALCFLVVTFKQINITFTYNSLSFTQYTCASTVYLTLNTELPLHGCSPFEPLTQTMTFKDVM